MTMSVNRWQLNKSDYDLLHDIEILNLYALQLTQPQLRLHQPNINLWISPQFTTLIRIAKTEPYYWEITTKKLKNEQIWIRSSRL